MNWPECQKRERKAEPYTQCFIRTDTKKKFKNWGKIIFSSQWGESCVLWSPFSAGGHHFTFLESSKVMSDSIDLTLFDFMMMLCDVVTLSSVRIRAKVHAHILGFNRRNKAPQILGIPGNTSAPSDRFVVLLILLQALHKLPRCFPSVVAFRKSSEAGGPQFG